MDGRSKRPWPAWLLDGVRPFYWSYFWPAAWNKLVTDFDDTLSPHFSLLTLPTSAWQKPRIQQLLFSGFLLTPAIITLLITALPGTDHAAAGIWLGLAMGLLIGITFALVISLASGILVAAVGTAVYLIILGGEGVLTVDLLFQPRFGLVLGACAATAVSVLIAPTPAVAPYTRLRQVGSMIVGVLVSGIILAVAVGVTSIVVSNWQRGRFNNLTTAGVIGLTPFTIFVLTAWLRSRSWQRGLLGGTVIGVLIGSLAFPFLRSAAYETDIAGNVLRGIVVVVVTATFLLLFTLPYVLADRLGGIWAGRVAGGLSSLAVHVAFDAVFTWYQSGTNLIWHLLLVAAGLTIHLWRPLLFYPFEVAWSTLLVQLERQRASATGSLLNRQPVFWDAYQYLPLVGLLDHLLLVAGHYPEELAPALTAVSNTRQRRMARLAQIELEAQRLASLSDVAAIAGIHEQLSAALPTDAVGALLRSFRRVSLDVAAALNQHSSYNRRLALTATADRLDGLVRELTRSNEAYAQRFRPIAAHWQQLIGDHIHALKTAVAQQQAIDDPYVIGVPLTAQQEIFVGRRDVSRRIEQLLLDRRGPPLLLYGQRRMGKTSLLNNLGRLLPQHVVPLFVDLQGPVSFASDHAGLLYNLARGMQRSAYDQRGILLPDLTRAAAAADAFTAFDVWLDRVERQLAADDQTRILLMMDEFEALDEALQSGRFRESFVLGTLRHLIQHRTRFKVLLAGSHTLDEFKRWSGYLINAEVLHLGCLQESEARQLIEQPIPAFKLAYPPPVSRRVYTLTGGHPFLLQLLCSEIIALKNSQPAAQRWVVTQKDVETAVPQALQRGALFFADIEMNQLSKEEMRTLQQLARLGEGAVFTHTAITANPNGEAVMQRLLLRELITAVPHGFTFHIELVRRWLASLPRVPAKPIQ